MTNFADMSEEEQDQVYVGLAYKKVEEALESGEPEAWHKALQVVKDYLWYLKKD
jgi:hypothetical protein